MATKAAADPVNKVVFTVDLDNYLQSTIELASAIALANQTGIHGLFVEDLDLLHVASYSFTREISLVSAQARVLNNQQLLCSFNARSRHFRQSLLRHAEQSSLPWSFSTARGQKINMALEKSANAEYLIIGQSEIIRNQSGAPGFRTKRILFINNHNQRLLRVLDLIMDKFTGQPVELLVVSSPDESTGEYWDQLIKTLSTHPPHSRLTRIDHDSLLATLPIQSHSIDYVVASRHEPELVRQVIQQVSCPVILVS